jgi:hypothetical protein
VMTGGDGDDLFIFVPNSGTDTIIDFASGSDQIDLRSFASVDENNVSTTADGANTIVSVDTNDDTITDFSFTLVNSGPPTEADFVFA